MRLVGLLLALNLAGFSLIAHASYPLLLPTGPLLPVWFALAGRRLDGGWAGVPRDRVGTAALSEGNNPLTERERGVLAASAHGTRVADIAGTLALSEGTVRNYLSEAIQKLAARNRIEAAHIAREKGWL